MASRDTSVSDGQAAVLEKHRLNCSLDQIRLIRLNAKADTESQSSIITASIGIFPLNNTVPYIALSYVWGTDEPSNTIMLDGQQMRVRNNLWNFLNIFCREGDTSYLWIDALCINQSYIPERNHQVTLMGQIYSQATKVIAWLGADPDLIEATRDLLRSKRLYHGNTVFCTADYWRRAWIRQEFILAKEVEIRCGTVSVSTEMVDKMMAARVRPMDPYHERVWHILQSRRERLYHEPFYDILPITDMTRAEEFRLECGDPRDQIYSLLGLINKETLQKYPINVDYTISTFELYEKLAARHWKMKNEGWFENDSSNRLFRFALKVVLGLPIKN